MVNISLNFLIVLLFIFVTPIVVAQEEISFTLPENSIQTYEIPLEVGDKITYSISLLDNHVIDFSITTPDNSEFTYGQIENVFESSFIADVDGIYKFIFDNSISLEDSKQFDFHFIITKVEYDVYIDDLPDSDLPIKNIIETAFDFWKQEFPDLRFNFVDNPQDANLNIQFVKDFGTEHVGYALGTSYMEVGLGDNDCRGNWQPYSENHVSHIIKHELGHILGLGHSNDPENIMFSVSQGKEYAVIEEVHTFAPGYGQFIPFCTSKELSAFEIDMETDDPEHGFKYFSAI